MMCNTVEPEDPEVQRVASDTFELYKLPENILRQEPLHLITRQTIFLPFVTHYPSRDHMDGLC